MNASVKIKLLFLCSLLVCVNMSPTWNVYNYAEQFLGGTGDMWRSWRDNRNIDMKGVDKYFRAKANYEAASRGLGGRHAAAFWSEIKSFLNYHRWNDVEEDKLDREADEWGRNLNDPQKYRPWGLDPSY